MPYEITTTVPSLYLRLDLLFKFHLVLGVQVQRSFCYSTYPEAARQPANLAVHARTHLQHVLSFFHYVAL